MNPVTRPADTAARSHHGQLRQPADRYVKKHRQPTCHCFNSNLGWPPLREVNSSASACCIAATTEATPCRGNVYRLRRDTGFFIIRCCSARIAGGVGTRTVQGGHSARSGNQVISARIPLSCRPLTDRSVKTSVPLSVRTAGSQMAGVALLRRIAQFGRSVWAPMALVASSASGITASIGVARCLCRTVSKAARQPSIHKLV